MKKIFESPVITTVIFVEKDIITESIPRIDGNSIIGGYDDITEDFNVIK